MTKQEIYDQVFTSDMEYPEGMTDDQARAIWCAHERRFLAWEMAYQMSDPDWYPWAKDALAAVERGDTTVKEIFEEAWSHYYNEDRSYVYLFERARDHLV